MKRQVTRCALLVLFMSISAIALAEESSHSEHGEAEHHKNRVAGFVGITDEDRRERALTLGADYSRRLSPCFSVGVGIERAAGDLDFTVVTVPVFYHLHEWTFFAGPGWEKVDDEDGSGS